MLYILFGDFFLVHIMVSFPSLYVRLSSLVLPRGCVVPPWAHVPACSYPNPNGRPYRLCPVLSSQGSLTGRSPYWYRRGPLNGEQAGGSWRLQPLPQGEDGWGPARTRAGVGNGLRKPESQDPALIPSGEAPHLVIWGPTDVGASQLSGPSLPPFPKEVGVVCVPKVKACQ